MIPAPSRGGTYWDSSGITEPFLIYSFVSVVHTCSKAAQLIIAWDSPIFLGMFETIICSFKHMP